MCASPAWGPWGPTGAWVLRGRSGAGVSQAGRPISTSPSCCFQFSVSPLPSATFKEPKSSHSAFLHGHLQSPGWGRCFLQAQPPLCLLLASHSSAALGQPGPRPPGLRACSWLPQPPLGLPSSFALQLPEFCQNPLTVAFPILFVLVDFFLPLQTPCLSFSWRSGGSKNEHGPTIFSLQNSF